MLKPEITLRTGFLQAGHAVSSGAVIGRLRVNWPPQAAQLPSHSSYSYKGMSLSSGIENHSSGWEARKKSAPTNAPTRAT